MTGHAVTVVPYNNIGFKRKFGNMKLMVNWAAVAPLQKCICQVRALWARQSCKRLLLIGLPAILALFKYAHTGLNADIILNQIMALHNPTLFYWGQNRILNVLPFLLSGIKWPMFNLFLALLFATASFFGLIYLISALAVKISEKSNDYAYINLIYIFNISVCIFLFKPQGWIEICLWHFEYSFALLLAGINLYFWFFKPTSLACITLPFVFVALGVNPSLILVFGLILIFHCYSMWRISWKDIFIFIFYLASFSFWLWTSRQYGSFADYSTLILAKYNEGVEKFIINFSSSYMKMGNLLCVIGGIAAMSILTERIGHKISNTLLAGKISCYYLFAAILLTLFIACIRWYHMNEYSPRYFIFLIYGAVFIFSLWALHFIKIYNNFYKILSFLSIILFILCIYFFYPPTFNLQKCIIYESCNRNTPVTSSLYAGDYWQTWACMSRDINNGHNSYAMVYRSSPDRSNIINRIKNLQTGNEPITVWCLNADPKICEKQLSDYFLDYTLEKSERINAETVKFYLNDIRIAPKEAS